MESITIGTIRLRMGRKKSDRNRYHEDPVMNPVIEELARMFGFEVPMTLSPAAGVHAYEIEGSVMSILPSTQTITTSSGEEALTEVILQGPTKSSFWTLLNIAYAAAARRQ